jgi:thiol-disulfide isomerase/thioredoxin
MICNAKWGRKAVVAFFLGFLFCSAGAAYAGDSAVLNVGDKIPELKYDKWLKGTPFKDYQKGRLYIFEFWATWCGPCIMSMPHLSGIAKKYKDQLTVVGVDIWEHDENHSSTVDPARFVKQMGNKMAFNVVTDTKDGWMGNNWMKAAGQGGIPCSFMVKDGIILWIGHPINLDSVIGVVNSGKYDPVAVREEFRKKAVEEQAQAAAMHKVIDPIDSAEKAKDWPKALQLLEAGKTQSPPMAGYFDFKKFMILLDNYSEDTAMAFVKPWQATKPGYTGSTAAVILHKKGLKKGSYSYGIELMQGLLSQPNAPVPLYREMIAAGYANAGDYKMAVETQQIVVNEAKEALNAGKYAGFVTKDTLDKYEKALAEYKSHLNQ